MRSVEILPSTEIREFHLVVLLGAKFHKRGVDVRVDGATHRKIRMGSAREEEKGVYKGRRLDGLREMVEGRNFGGDGDDGRESEEDSVRVTGENREWRVVVPLLFCAVTTRSLVWSYAVLSETP